MRQPDVASALWWFGQTHEVVSTGFGAYWRLSWLPHAGSIAEQDAWLWDALQILKAEHSRDLNETHRSRRDDATGRHDRTHRN